MKKIALLLALCLTACTNPGWVRTEGGPVTTGRIPCHVYSNCTIGISVTEDRDPLKCLITGVEPIDVYGRLYIFWNSTNPDYRFTATGIDPKLPLPPDQFQVVGPSPGNLLFAWKSLSRVAGNPIEYTIRMEGKGRTCVFDPVIINRGGA